ncbi:MULTISPECIES: UDP-galactopyranose mutase [unclassified Saccharibacter]|uniref:UDP-galactopyranose mutase n=1 Tax=unclassified Saccharibacter TaxID=2648722 RepID=UPI0013286E22|nr:MULTISPECIES: UDP-galactopyranose mutase [unclassified Saccharibacter]MXV36025.1 UDP-galactopyranose mutase [Saccharibacter sp. EH611]MXV56884.1 UDP-galactopyranose mutase [Saccharibacter sp. EH70]MXV66756.1 UDP-galactopyranose mutase [Saccharibacter sp. EH60]
MKFCIVGAGFSGAVIARHLAQQGHTVTLAEERSHIGGNCHTSRDPDTHVMLHHYGPHIFHTAHQHVWEYVQKFATFQPYINRVKAISGGRVYSLPINLFTINQFFGKTLRPDEAQEFLKEKSDSSIKNPQNFEEQALSMIGPELYQAFFRGYTLKQWGVDPTSLPASILKRLPVRFNYDDNYFNHPYQGIPEEGYTTLIENILDHPNIHLHLNTAFEALTAAESYDHIFYTGPIDRYFKYCHGRLGYRTLDFERFDADGDYQGTAVMNYCDEDVPYTRISEHKHFAPWEAAHLKKTTCFREYSRLATPEDAPYYPIRLTTEMSRLERYLNQAETTEGVSFLGRLGTYRYLDMDRTIAEALSACTVIDQKLAHSSPIPSFFTDPHSA